MDEVSGEAVIRPDQWVTPRIVDPKNPDHIATDRIRNDEAIAGFDDLPDVGMNCRATALRQRTARMAAATVCAHQANAAEASP